MERVRGGPGGRYLPVGFTFRRVPPTSSALLSLGGFLPAHRIARDFPNICAGPIRIRVTQRRMSQRLLSAREKVGPRPLPGRPFDQYLNTNSFRPSGSSTV